MINTLQGYDRQYYRGKNSNYLFWYRNLKARFFWRRRLAMIDAIAGRKNARLLDVGCAFGYFLKFLERRCQVHGVDISGYAVQQARALLSDGSRIKVFDIRDGIPFKEQFDVITAFDVMEHIENPLQVLESFKKMLHPNGVLYLELPTKKTIVNFDTSHRYRDLDAWRSMLGQAGFRMEQIRGYYTIGMRMVMIPVRSERKQNYCSIVAGLR
jgi:2-polyprenyl-3-methyl-5-hydroxy-6-metoxy-1,4-benzoquinol methylase